MRSFKKTSRGNNGKKKVLKSYNFLKMPNCQFHFDLLLVMSRWLSLITALLSMCLIIVSMSICSMVLLGTEARQTGP